MRDRWSAEERKGRVVHAEQTAVYRGDIRRGWLVKHEDLGTHQVQSDGRTVWVNEATGGAVARVSQFGETVMIDVHRPFAEQCTQGECLDCRHDLAGADAWEHFKGSVLQHFGVQVTEKHRPRWA